MKLDAFFEQLAPLLEGRVGLPTVAPALYGPDWRASTDAKRLGIYAEFCAQHRLDALSHVFTDTARALGAEAWSQTVHAYFAAHPMHHVELNENGASLSAFLSSQDSLPPWLYELADFEWWEWQTRIAARDGNETEGPLRLSKTVEVRPYHYDLVAWLHEGAHDAPVSS
jgi:hypothetical protein